MSNLSVTLVRHTDGTIDQEGSEEAFRLALSKHISEHETEQATIAGAVTAVFDQYKGASLNMPALASKVLERLSVQPENFKSMDERVKTYVRENAQGDKDKATGLVERPESTYVIGKGKGGGVKRRADMKPAEAAAANKE